MGRSYPWYDSIWLDRYVRAKELIRRQYPTKLAEFLQTFACLRTRSDFEVQRLPRVFDDAVMADIKQAIRALPPMGLELHEVRSFGRFIVYDHPLFTELQKTTEALVGEAVGEPVEAQYNFLSLYTKLGVCPVHLDAPESENAWCRLKKYVGRLAIGRLCALRRSGQCD